MKYNRCYIFIALIIACSLLCTIIVNSVDSHGVDASSTLSQVRTFSTQNKAIIIVPGITCSTLVTNDNYEDKVWLSNSEENLNLLKLYDNGLPKHSLKSKRGGSLDIDSLLYNELLNDLNEEFGDDYTVELFHYDWRFDNNTTAILLENYVSSYDEIILISHSMGGLVCSKFLDRSANNREKTKLFVAVGTPFVGAAKCINAMQTGEMIHIDILDYYFAQDIIKTVSRNSYAAYQLLPNLRYTSVTGTYPLTVNGAGYASGAWSQLKKTEWAKTGTGDLKLMFDNAYNFHESLYNNNTHIKDHSDVLTYTIAGIGQDTIKQVNFDSNYNIVGLTTANTGDGTVLSTSAGHGTPDFTVNAGHALIMNNNTVIQKICDYINLAINSSDRNIRSIEEQSYIVNARGWIVGRDNKRINIYTDNMATITQNGMVLSEFSEKVVDHKGNIIGSVWKLGNTGKKFYSLFDGEYTVSGSSTIKIEYMEDGYYQKVLEYSNVDYDNCSVKTTSFADLNNDIATVQHKAIAIYTYTENELDELNKDGQIHPKS